MYKTYNIPIYVYIWMYKTYKCVVAKWKQIPLTAVIWCYWSGKEVTHLQIGDTIEWMCSIFFFFSKNELKTIRQLLNVTIEEAHYFSPCLVLLFCCDIAWAYHNAMGVQRILWRLRDFFVYYIFRLKTHHIWHASQKLLPMHTFLISY